jgi:uncharacterized protein YgiM (DUF1202 family)
VSKERNHKLVVAIPGVLFIAVAAGLLTYGASIAVAEATKPKPAIKKTVVVVKEEPKVEEPAPVVEAPAPAPVARTATTKSFVRFRAARSTSSAVLAELQGGTVVTLGDYADTKWQQATYNGQTGYIAKVYLQY